MDRVRRTHFDPLAVSKSQVLDIVQRLPVGSAHPFSPERILVCRTEDGVEEIDISSHPADFFFNAVDLGEMGEVLLRRMAGFSHHLNVFNDFQIMQAPASTFSIPLVDNQITLLAVSTLHPTYYDFCFGDAMRDTCCWLARETFSGMTHSGDILSNGDLCNGDLLDYVRIKKDTFTDKELCVFISGYQKTPITRFKGTHPALMVANHVDKILNIVPVPLDVATIGDSTICCPLVIKRDGDSLVCSILPKATTDREMMCCSKKLATPCFEEAISCANFTLDTHKPVSEAIQDSIVRSSTSNDESKLHPDIVSAILAKEVAVISTGSVVIPKFLDPERCQKIQFGAGLEFQLPGQGWESTEDDEQPLSPVVLPCIFGSALEGPMLLATGKAPVNVPMSHAGSLCEYYRQLGNIVVVVDERMTDNARSIAGPYRMNALFIVQLSPDKEPESTDQILALMDAANINAVSALAGPQSLILIQIYSKLYFYRGLANLDLLDTTKTAFGTEVTFAVESVGMKSILHPKAERIVNINDENNAIILPGLNQLTRPRELTETFRNLNLGEILDLERDIVAAVPQLQMLLSEKEVQDLSKTLVSTVSAKIGEITEPLRREYISFLTGAEYSRYDPASVAKKSRMLGELRKVSRETQKTLEPVISSLANLMSAQTTSKRTHDLKRLVRKAKIQGNVAATQSMTFETLEGYLETHAAEMGVLLLDVYEEPYRELLRCLGSTDLITRTQITNSACDLSRRLLHLEGFDAGIILSQSQAHHTGPLSHPSTGPSHPTLSLPCLTATSNDNYDDDDDDDAFYYNGSLRRRRGVPTSSLAWVCWDEFVTLRDPFSVRWLERCNEPHIAAARILMRDTLSRAVASRESALQPGSPETGQLMGALLMAAMGKLAGRRSGGPPPPPAADAADAGGQDEAAGDDDGESSAVAMATGGVVEAEQDLDTVTRLMRGLFGTLLTAAGSGVRPLSMVWQLLGREVPRFDVPAGPVDWLWYETVVRLYPYTGWPRRKFHGNLERLLDKVVLRAVTRAEDVREVKKSRVEELVRICRLRNVQLENSRSIVAVWERMLGRGDGEDDGGEVDVPAVATRLLAHLPKVESKKLKDDQVVGYREQLTRGYTQMVRYLEHLSIGGHRRVADDLVIVNTHTKRSAAFGDLKDNVVNAMRENDWNSVKSNCQAILDERANIAARWGISVEPNRKHQLKKIKVQNLESYEALLAASTESEPIINEASRKVLSDAERTRVPWQVGKPGQFGDDIEPLDQVFVHEMLTGEQGDGFLIVDSNAADANENSEQGSMSMGESAITGPLDGRIVPDFSKFSLRRSFVAAMQSPDLTAEDVCMILEVPVNTMRVFVQALDDKFEWSGLGPSFQDLVMGLLECRSGRDESRPMRRLLGIATKEKNLGKMID